MHAGHGNSSDSRAKARLGLFMFALYGIVYAGFVLINTIAPDVMERIAFAGLDLAVIYGMGLIVLAVVLGLIYSQICSRLEARAIAAGTGEEQ